VTVLRLDLTRKPAATVEGVESRRYACRPMLGLRKAIQVVVAVTTLAGVAPALSSAARPQTASPAKRCEWAAAHKAHLGVPLITDARGSYVAVLFVDHRDNYERFCLYGPHIGVGTSGQIRSPALIDTPPGANGIQHNNEGGSCDPTTGHAVGEMFGRVGTNVTGVIFKFSNGASIQASVKNGFYVAWWPSAFGPDGMIVKTKSGTTTEIQMQGGSRDSC
jgi:hypothetical protein